MNPAPTTSAAAETVRVRLDGRAAWITLDRPPLNIMDIAMIQSLGRALDALPAECAFVVFHGVGPKCFSAGAEVGDHLPDRVAGMLAAFHGVFRKLNRAPWITIAAVHGVCLGGGMELAAFCDFVIATESAKFGQPEIKLGCFPPVAMAALPRIAGPRAAMDLILTGRVIPAREAQALGIATRVVADDALESSVQALLADLGWLSPAALRITRDGLRRLDADAFERELDAAEKLYLHTLMKTEDAHEGIRAFLEKRAPVWRGR